MPSKLEENLRYTQFMVNAFPLEDFPVIMPISVLLQQMAIYVLVDFRAALDLYAYCALQFGSAVAKGDHAAAAGFTRQAYVPARDGAMTIFHFGVALAEIRGRVGQSSALLKRVATEELKIAEAQFKTQFPKYRLLRHGVAHLSEQLGKLNLDAFLNETSPFPSLYNRQFRAHWKGADYSYSLSEETLSQLEAVFTLVCGAFRQAHADSVAVFTTGQPLAD